MVTYSVHMPPGGVPRTLEGSDKLVFVKDGFKLAAFIVPVLWFLYRRMWLAFLGYLVAVLVIQTVVMLANVPDFASAALAFGFALLVALEAGTLRRWSLRRKGFETLFFVSGANLAECETKAFALWATPLSSREISSARGPVAAPVVETSKSTSVESDPEIIGLFPQSGPAR